MARLQIKRRSQWNHNSNNKNSQQSKSMTSRVRPRPEWNSYLTDANRFKLTKSELLEKKRLYVSPNNMLSISKNSQVSTIRSKICFKKPYTKYLSDNIKQDDQDRLPKEAFLNANSLDLIQHRSSEDLIALSISTDPTKTINTCKNKEPSLKTEIFPASKLNMTTFPESMPKEKKFTKTTQIQTVKSTLKNKDNNDSKIYIHEEDLKEIIMSIKSLNRELIGFEQISGRRSSLADPEELEMALHGELYKGDVDKALQNISHTKVLRYLLQLVCQTMTYLLQGEMTIQGQRRDVEALTMRVETLSKLVVPSTPTEAALQKKQTLTSPSTQPLALHKSASLPTKHDMQQHKVQSETKSAFHEESSLLDPYSKLQRSQQVSQKDASPSFAAAVTVANVRPTYRSSEPMSGSTVASQAIQTASPLSDEVTIRRNTSGGHALSSYSSISIPSAATTPTAAGGVPSPQISRLVSPIAIGTSASDWLLAATQGTHARDTAEIPQTPTQIPAHRVPITSMSSVVQPSPSAVRGLSTDVTEVRSPVFTPIAHKISPREVSHPVPSTATAPYMRIQNELTYNHAYNSPAGIGDINANDRSCIVSQSLEDRFEEAWVTTGKSKTVVIHDRTPTRNLDRVKAIGSPNSSQAGLHVHKGVDNSRQPSQAAFEKNSFKSSNSYHNNDNESITTPTGGYYRAPLEEDTCKSSTSTANSEESDDDTAVSIDDLIGLNSASNSDQWHHEKTNGISRQLREQQVLPLERRLQSSRGNSFLSSTIKVPFSTSSSSSVEQSSAGNATQAQGNVKHLMHQVHNNNNSSNSNSNSNNNKTSPTQSSSHSCAFSPTQAVMGESTTCSRPQLQSSPSGRYITDSTHVAVTTSNSEMGCRAFSGPTSGSGSRKGPVPGPITIKKPMETSIPMSSKGNRAVGSTSHFVSPIPQPEVAPVHPFTVLKRVNLAHGHEYSHSDVQSSRPFVYDARGGSYSRSPS